MCVAKAPNAMPERRQSGSISRTSLKPKEHYFDRQCCGTFRLRHILAKDGCKESQVSLAKSLLTASSSGSDDTNFNAQLAIYWLLQAAEKGQEEAFILLKSCFSAGIGITAANLREVEICLKFSEVEKISRRIAFSLFYAIMSDTEDIIPEEIFKEKIDCIFKEDAREKLSSKIDEEVVHFQHHSEKVSENVNLCSQSHVSFRDVVSSVQSCLEGNVPLVSLKQVSHYAECRKWFFFKYLNFIWYFLINSTEKLISNLNSLTVPYSALCMLVLIQTFILFFPSYDVTVFLKSNMLFTILTFFFLTMLSTTCFIINLNFDSDNLMKWLHLINFFEPNTKSDEIERKFFSKAIYPFITFFLISFLYVWLVPLDSFSTIFKDIGLLSLLLACLVDRIISKQRYYVNISFAVNALICLYKSNVLNFSFLNWFSFLNFNINYEIVQNVYVHVNFASCFALPFVLPYLYAKMCCGGYKNWQLVLFPHLMSITWMNLAFINMKQSTSFELLISIFTWFTIFICTKYIGFFVTLIIYISLHVTFALEDQKLYIIIFSLILITLYTVISYVFKKFQASHEKLSWCLILCLIALIISYQTTKPLTSLEKQSEVLSWEKYQTYCHHYAWYRTNAAQVQISCLPLQEKEIAMEGTVTAINVVEIKNDIEFFFKLLPEPLKSWLTCSLGINYEGCDTDSLKTIQTERYNMYKVLNMQTCNLENWNRYKFQITFEVTARTSPEVILYADNICSDFIANLKEGDSLQVIGILKSNIGNSSPHFKLKYAECHSCYSNVFCNSLKTFSVTSYNFSLKNILWFYFSPFILYETR